MTEFDMDKAKKDAQTKADDKWGKENEDPNDSKAQSFYDNDQQSEEQTEDDGPKKIRPALKRTDPTDYPRMKEIILALDYKDDSLWDGDGWPSLAAVSKEFKYQVTRPEIQMAAPGIDRMLVETMSKSLAELSASSQLILSVCSDPAVLLDAVVALSVTDFYKRNSHLRNVAASWTAAQRDYYAHQDRIKARQIARAETERRGIDAEIIETKAAKGKKKK